MPTCRETTARGNTRLCILKPVYTLQHVETIFKKKELIPHELVNCRMYVHWREREHKDIDFLVGEDPDAIATLAQCGLLKFFQCPFMQAQPRLLNALVGYWHPDVEEFMLEGHSLTLMTKDIYFLRRGEPVNFHTFPSGPHNIVELIELHCKADIDKVGTQVSINKISNLSLKVIVFLIGQITGSTTLHQASQVHMNCAVQCLNAQIFD
jgi:hypothetical protein